jgi:hypothetical protein
VQTIRGIVTDYDSKFPLVGVNVILYKDSTIAKVVSTVRMEITEWGSPGWKKTK